MEEANGALTKYTFDGKNRVTSVENAIEAITTFQYDLRDNLIRNLSQFLNKEAF